MSVHHGLSEPNFERCACVPGPDHWADLGYKNCDRHRQSPIAIETSSAVRKRMKPLEFYHFDEIPLTMNLTNNHHSGEWSVPGRSVASQG